MKFRESPVVNTAGHLQVTDSGVVLATWQLMPLTYGRAAVDKKAEAVAAHRALFRKLAGTESVLQGFAVAVDPVSIVERQIDGIDLDEHPGLAAEAAANLDRLSEWALGERVCFLTVPLANNGVSKYSSTLMASRNKIARKLGLAVTCLSDKEIELRLKQAALVEESIPARFKPRRITLTDQIWLASRSHNRGLLDSIPVDENGASTFQPGCAIPQVVLDPQAKTDLEAAKLVNPLKRRILKVTDTRDIDAESSYQAFMVMARPPKNGLASPGSEVFSWLDRLGPEIDWTIRMNVVNREKTLAQNRRALRKLQDQLDQRDTDHGTEIDMLSEANLELGDSANSLAEYQAEFAGDTLEVEVQHAVVLAVSAPTFEDADTEARQVVEALAQQDFVFDRPVGAEITLWEAMQAGYPISPLIRTYTHYTSGSNFARLVPCTTTKLGGSKGMATILNVANARPSIAHINPHGYPELNMSGSIALSGELGVGKSYLAKSIMSNVVLEGGQVATIDKSPEKEWAVWARALPPNGTLGKVIVVDPDPNSTASTDGNVILEQARPEWSMDPLRASVRLSAGAASMEAFLSSLLHISPQTRIGAYLSRTLQPKNLQAAGIASSEDLVNHFRREAVDGGVHHRELAQDISERLELYVESTYGPLIFDASIPAVDPRASVIVWCTSTMKLPKEEELSSDRLFAELPLERLFARAYYRLMTSCAKQWGERDRSRPFGFAVDEAHNILGNFENVGDIEAIVREGRRNKVFTLLSSQSPGRDFGNKDLLGLIAIRIAMRQRAADLARESIEFLGIDPADPQFDDMVKELREDVSPVEDDIVGVPMHRRGEGFLRDPFGGVGRIKVLGPALPELARAVSTTPPKNRRAKAAV